MKTAREPLRLSVRNLPTVYPSFTLSFAYVLAETSYFADSYEAERSMMHGRREQERIGNRRRESR